MTPPAPVRAACRRRHSAGGFGLALLLLGGCSGSRFGEALSRSFSAGGPTSASEPPPGPLTSATAPAPAREGNAGSAASPPPVGAANTPATAAALAPIAKVQGNPAATSVPASAAAKRPPASSSSPPPAAAGSATAGAGGVAAPTRPAPYRVTILLPQADAAAPAEVVTQALRSAGVPFEVETIERLNSATTPQAPVSRPVPAPR